MEENKALERIITDTRGQMLVIACPGSGKTTTLLRRIHDLTEQQKVPEHTVFMITFTRAAAREMRQRYGAMYRAAHAVTFSTIHALCLATLRKFAGSSQKNLVSNPADDLFPAIRGNKTIRDKGRFMKEALLDISVVKNSQMSPEEYQPACCDDPRLFCHIYRYWKNTWRRTDSSISTTCSF